MTTEPWSQPKEGILYVEVLSSHVQVCFLEETRVSLKESPDSPVLVPPPHYPGSPRGALCQPTNSQRLPLRAPGSKVTVESDSGMESLGPTLGAPHPVPFLQTTWLISASLPRHRHSKWGVFEFVPSSCKAS